MRSLRSHQEKTLEPSIQTVHSTSIARSLFAFFLDFEELIYLVTKIHEETSSLFFFLDVILFKS